MTADTTTKPVNYSGQVRVRAIPEDGELPPLEGEIWPPTDHSRLEADVIQTLSIPVGFVAE